MTTAFSFATKLRTLKPLLAGVLALVVVLPAAARSASDADVTLMKVDKVVIEADSITITAAQSKSRITLIRDDYDPAYTGDNWHGMPVTRVQIISNKSTFTIKRPDSARRDGPLVKAWQDSLAAAKDLQDGKEVGRIGFYAPDIVIKGNMLDSITGPGFLYGKGN